MREKLCIFGEVLFDIFPDGQKILGGAPFNVAWHLQAFKQSPFFISRVGDDPEGMDIRNTMLAWGMNTLELQTDKQLATGKVTIKLDDGEPEYEINEPVAYDAIDVPADKVTDCNLLYHGSLAIRNAVSRKSLNQLKNCKPATLFVDVNLRNPWWNKSVVTGLLHQADWVKLNADEFSVLYAADTGEKRLLSFVDEFGLQGVILTHGKAGAEVVTANSGQYRVKPGKAIKVIDAVGAGDAFSSMFILGLNKNWALSATLQRAQDFASAIVEQRGATVSDKSFYQHFINAWDIRGARVAVKVFGSINDPITKDEKWTVEIAFPWNILTEVVPGGKHPVEGDLWRINFSRVEWETKYENGKYIVERDSATGKRLPENNWVWSPQGIINMHYPEMWGFLQFSEQVSGRGEDLFSPDPDKQIKWELRKLYYKQRLYFEREKRYASVLSELGIMNTDKAGLSVIPEIQVTNNMFEITLPGSELDQSWHIRQDGKIWSK